jgi:transcriptional regulator with XRE-family HTH domain
MITSAQLRAARALVDWKQSDLADHSNVAERTIRLFEREQRKPYAQTLDALQGALERAGVLFIETEAGRGVVLIDDAQR